jgi:hypothetical protein
VTTATLIALNAALGGGTVFGIVKLLARGIRTDVGAATPSTDVQPLVGETRLAA